MALGDLFGVRPEQECKTCEALREALYHERALNELLIRKLLYKDEPQQIESPKHEPILPKLVPWAMKRAQLENESRLKAKELTEAERLQTEKLEKELKLDIPEADNVQEKEG